MRKLSWCVVLFAAYVLSISFAHAACKPGYGECPDRLGGGCAPLGNVCCAGGTNAPPGSVCCKGGTHCEKGQICIKDGKCLAKTSMRYCPDGGYCNEGYRCGSDSKCYMLQVSPPPSVGGSRDSSSGVADARNCIDVSTIKAAYYRIKNTCTFRVKVRLETMEFSPKSTSVDTYDIDPQGDITAYSYHGYQPVVVSACGAGSC